MGRRSGGAVIASYTIYLTSLMICCYMSRDDFDIPDIVITCLFFPFDACMRPYDWHVMAIYNTACSDSTVYQSYQSINDITTEINNLANQRAHMLS